MAATLSGHQGMSVSIWAEKAGCGAGELGGRASPRERVGGKDLGRVQLTQEPILFTRPDPGTYPVCQAWRGHMCELTACCEGWDYTSSPLPNEPEQPWQGRRGQHSGPLPWAQLGMQNSSILQRAHGSLLSKCGCFSHSHEPQVLPFDTALYCWDSSPS